MSASNRKYPYEDSPIALLLRKRIDELAPVKTQREIAADIGYDKPNVLSMYKRGEAKVPLDRLPDFARALEIDLALLFRAGLSQWWPGHQPELTAMFHERVVTTNERAAIRLLGTYLNEGDETTLRELLACLRQRFADDV